MRKKIIPVLYVMCNGIPHDLYSHLYTEILNNIDRYSRVRDSSKTWIILI
jgi:hypothetical protein